MIRVSDIRTERDCGYQLDLKDIKDGPLAKVMELLGVEPGSLGLDRIHAAAEIMHKAGARG
jgi:hypothetical protein